MSTINLLVFAALSFSPSSDYETREVEGWQVRVHKQLLADDVELGRQALELLRIKLFEVGRAVPTKPLTKLRETPIWLELANDEKNPCACYHPDEGWLKANDFNPEKVRCVEISNARRFVEWSKSQPAMLLHELAHGYHHRELTWEEPRILKAFEKAQEQGNYKTVLHISGDNRHAYAITNHKEYFAEASEAYFGTNDFFPFVKPELAHHDPDLFAVLQVIWAE